jgi:hypothetical protein
MNNKSFFRPFAQWTAAGFVCLAISLAGCSPGNALPPGEAAEATTSADNATSTAIVLQAQAMGTSLAAKANQENPVSTTIPRTPLPGEVIARTDTPANPDNETPAGGGTPEGEESSPKEGTPQGGVKTAVPIQVVDVTTAADGALLMVQYRAPARLSEKWRQGNVWVIDETSGTKYSEIPVMGTIGPVIAHPKVDGGLAYFMLVNGPVALKPGAKVTVVMGDFKEEHQVIQ